MSRHRPDRRVPGRTRRRARRNRQGTRRRCHAARGTPRTAGSSQPTSYAHAMACGRHASLRSLAVDNVGGHAMPIPRDVCQHQPMAPRAGCAPPPPPSLVTPPPARRRRQQARPIYGESAHPAGGARGGAVSRRAALALRWGRPSDGALSRRVRAWPFRPHPPATGSRARGSRARGDEATRDGAGGSACVRRRWTRSPCRSWGTCKRSAARHRPLAAAGTAEGLLPEQGTRRDTTTHHGTSARERESGSRARSDWACGAGGATPGRGRRRAGWQVGGRRSPAPELGRTQAAGRAGGRGAGAGSP